MGMLNESDFYPAFDTSKPFELVGEVWGQYTELRDVATRYSDGDKNLFTGLSINILPRGANRAEENVVSILVKKGGRLAELSKAIKVAGAQDISDGDTIAVKWDGSTKKMEKGDMRLWSFAYAKAAPQAAAGSLLGEAAADAEQGGGAASLLG